MALAAIADAAYENARNGREFGLTIEIRDGAQIVGGATVMISKK